LSEHFNLFRADNNYDRMANRLRQMYNCKVLIRIKKNRKKIKAIIGCEGRLHPPCFIVLHPYHHPNALLSNSLQTFLNTFSLLQISNSD
jgi:hypothetical protein